MAIQLDPRVHEGPLSLEQDVVRRGSTPERPGDGAIGGVRPDQPAALGNLTLDWAKSDRRTYEFDIEPKVFLDAPEGDPGWHNIVGYRRSFAWRFEALYIWTRSRNMIEDGFKTADNSIDIRVKRLF